MKTEEKEKNSSSKPKSKLNKSNLSNEIISYINNLSDSIRQYYKVSKMINKNKNIIINSIENELNASESILNTIFNENSLDLNLIESYKNVSKKTKETFNKLKLNINSEDKNLISFFEDAKIIFKKMKDSRQELIQLEKKRYSDRISNTPKNKDRTPDIIRKKNSDQVKNNLYENSEINYKVNNKFNDFEVFKKINYTEINKPAYNNDTINKLNPRTTIIPKRVDKFDENNKFNNTIDNANKFMDNSKLLIEMEKLRDLNKKYESKIKKLNIDLQKYQSELDSIRHSNSSNNKNSKENTLKTQDEFYGNKDKIISSLKEELEKNIKNYSELFNNFKNCQNQIKKLQEDNNKLSKQNEPDKNLINKLNKLVKENSILKNKIESLKTNNIHPYSDINYNLEPKSNELDKNNKNQKMEIDSLKKNIEIIKKKLVEEQTKNKELLNEGLVQKNKHEIELSQLSKRNTELSTILINKQNELLNLQKESLDKSKQIENLKISINSKDSQEKQMILESIKSIFEQENSMSNKPWNNLNESVNRILENYKYENEQLNEKIKYFQEQLKNAKNELLEKVQANIEIESKSKKQINDIKNDYNKKMEEVEHKNQIIDHYLNLCQEVNNNLMSRITQLNQKVSAKEMKIIQIQDENKQLKEKIEELYNLKNSNNLSSENFNLKLKEENIELTKKLDEQKQANERLKEESKKISNENNKLQNILLKNGIKVLGGYEFQISRDEAFEKLTDEIEQLKGQNELLKDMLETITKEFFDKQNEKNEKNEKYDDVNGSLKKEYNALEELKQKTLITLRNEDKIKELNNENEKLQQQIKKISKEYNDLQNQYDELENRYKSTFKNDGKNNSINTYTTISFTNNDEILNELKKVRKENEQIKKKNLALISQLEEKDIKRSCYDNKSEEGFKSNYEEEFNLKQLAKGSKDKNRSQDINIDYPGIQHIKEKYRELDFYYNSLEGLVKKLLMNIQVNPKNKAYVSELCVLVGFDLDTKNKILNNNKSNKKILGLFPK